MPAQTFAYTGRDAAGKLHKGRLEAGSEGAVASRLRGMGLSPVDVAPAAPATGLQMEIGPNLFQKEREAQGSGRDEPPDGDDDFVGALAHADAHDPLGADGEPQAAGHASRGPQGCGERLQPVARAVQASAHLPAADDPPGASGRTGGFLEHSLESAAKTFEADVKLRGTIKSAMTYPVVVLVMAVLAVVAMILFIVPVFEKMFADLGGELPLPTQFLVTLSKNAFWMGPVLLVLTIAAVAWWRANRHTDSVRSVVDRLRLRLPVFGPLFPQDRGRPVRPELRHASQLPVCPSCIRWTWWVGPQATGSWSPRCKRSGMPCASGALGVPDGGRAGLSADGGADDRCRRGRWFTRADARQDRRLLRSRGRVHYRAAHGAHRAS